VCELIARNDVLFIWTSLHSSDFSRETLCWPVSLQILQTDAPTFSWILDYLIDCSCYDWRTLCLKKWSAVPERCRRLYSCRVSSLRTPQTASRREDGANSIYLGALEPSVSTLFFGECNLLCSHLLRTQEVEWGDTEAIPSQLKDVISHVGPESILRPPPSGIRDACNTSLEKCPQGIWKVSSTLRRSLNWLLFFFFSQVTELLTQSQNLRPTFIWRKLMYASYIHNLILFITNHSLWPQVRVETWLNW